MKNIYQEYQSICDDDSDMEEEEVSEITPVVSQPSSSSSATVNLLEKFSLIESSWKKQLECS